MNLPAFLNGVPRVLLLAAVPIAAFVLAVGAGFGMSGDSSSSPDPTPNLGALAELTTPTTVPTPRPTVAPTATSAPNREDCDEIQGTDYLSPEERQWYLDNCSGNTTALSADNGGGAPAIDYTTSGPTNAGGGEYPLGDRLVIPAIGVDTSVYGTTVGADGAMPDPYGYFYAVWYDFSSHPGLGGYVSSGNLVMAGHVDCAACHNGASGAAVFYYTRNLSAGDTIQYITGAGEVHNYVVTQSVDYGAGTNWAGVVASNTADLTLITCNGTFNYALHEYDLRHVVYAKEV